jgi:hypothetical protein
MPRTKSTEQLLDYLDHELGWRRVELSALRTALERARGPSADMAARSAVALSYAHWEGYVIRASQQVVAYVSGLRLRYQDLSDPYLALCLSGRLGHADQSSRRIQRHLDVVVALRRSGDRAVFPTPERVIRAEGNLKSAKFDDILLRLGLSSAPFELHYNWIDGELLRRRNSVAHGDSGHADVGFGLEAISTVNDLLDRYRNAMQNAVVQQVFRIPNA